jgi:hypothetical protein
MKLPPVEVGNRAASCWKMMAALGVKGRYRKRAINTMAQAAEREHTIGSGCGGTTVAGNLTIKSKRLIMHLLLSRHPEDVLG